MQTLTKMKSSLEYWIEINTAHDIIDCPFQRIEYAPYVVTAFARRIPMADIPENVLKQLEQAIKDEASIQPPKPTFITKLKQFISRYTP